MRELVDYWANDYDWRVREARLNAFPQYHARLGGLAIHFYHLRSPHAHAVPLLMTHGWPGSFMEFEAAIGPLVEQGFDVVVPSLPGYGFSDRPTAPGMNTFRIAQLWTGLMQELGYPRFAAQGGDIGASVTTLLGLRHADRVLGIHLNYIPGSYRPYLEAGTKLAAVEQKFLDDADRWYAESGAYAHIQRTKPITAAYGPNDSPAALAAWILEKFRDWADCAGDVETRFTRDELLTNVTLYWMTETIHSSFRLYYEGRKAPLHFNPGERVQVPCAIAHFPKEEPFPPRPWIERGYNIQRWTEMPSGGHFAAAEEPELLARDIREFFRDFRASL